MKGWITLSAILKIVKSSDIPDDGFVSANVRVAYVAYIVLKEARIFVFVRAITLRDTPCSTYTRVWSSENLSDCNATNSMRGSTSSAFSRSAFGWNNVARNGQHHHAFCFEDSVMLLGD